MQEQIERMSFMAVGIAMGVSKITLSSVVHASQSYLQHSKYTGKQSLKHLNMQGRQLESVPITDEDIGAFKRELKKLGVDFSIIRDRTTGDKTVYFKGQDVERIQAALTSVLAKVKQRLEREEKMPLKQKIQLNRSRVKNIEQSIDRVQKRGMH